MFCVRQALCGFPDVLVGYPDVLVGYCIPESTLSGPQSVTEHSSAMPPDPETATKRLSYRLLQFSSAESLMASQLYVVLEEPNSVQDS